MRIISEFHDYYDVIQAQGQDQSVVWIRKQEEVALHRQQDRRWHFYSGFPFPICGASTYYRWHPSKFWCYTNIIGFCGRIYPVLELQLPSQEEVTLCFTMEEVDAFFEKNFGQKDLQGYRQTKGYNREWHRVSRRDTFQKFFQKCEEKKGAYEEKWFRDKRCPVFVANYRPRGDLSKITFNARLKEWQFYRIFDTYSAFQEIYCYMTGLAIPQEVVPDIDDKTLAEAKGFNEWSFRKEPTKRR